MGPRYRPLDGAARGRRFSTCAPHTTPLICIGLPMEDMLSAVVFRGDEGEVLRQASAVVGRPVVLWEIIGPHQAVPRASSGPDVGARPPGFDLDAILQLSMESIGRWVDLAADRRLALLDDLGQVLEDLDRTSEMLRAMRESARARMLTARGGGGARFDAVRVVRSCLTLERRLLRDRGVDLDFTTTLESTFVRGDSNA